MLSRTFFFVHVKLHQGVLVFFFSLSKSIDFAGMCTSITDCWCMGKEFFIFIFFLNLVPAIFFKKENRLPKYDLFFVPKYFFFFLHFSIRIQLFFS